MKRGNRRSKQNADASPTAAAADDREKRIRELELENQAFQKEVEELRSKLANASSTSGVDNSAQKLRENYLQKLTFLEDLVAVLTRKLDAQSQLSTQRRRGDESAKPFQIEMQRLKAQKVQMQCKMKLESVQFRLHKALLKKEVLQLKKESRRNKHEVHKLLASNQRLKTVLHRKTEEASVATKQLRRLLESRKALLLKRGGKKGNNAATQLVQEIEHEAEVTEQLNELCGVYERQIEEMAEEAAKLQEEVEALQQERSRCSCQEKDVDSFEQDLGMTDLKDQVVSLSSMVEQLRLHKAELAYGKSQDVKSQHIASVGSSIYNSAEDISPSASENSTVETSKTASPVCCSCSKYSLCKTIKCKCRSKGGSCGASCGCAASKCSNRKAVPMKPSDSPLSEIANGILNCSNSSETVKSSIERVNKHQDGSIRSTSQTKEPKVQFAYDITSTKVDSQVQRVNKHQDGSIRSISQTKEPTIFGIPASAFFPKEAAAIPSGKPSVSLPCNKSDVRGAPAGSNCQPPASATPSLDKSDVRGAPAGSNCQPPASATPSLDSSKGPKNMHWEERFHQLQLLLRKLDQSDHEDYLKILWSLSSVELSRYAVELEKRSIQLSLEEVIGIRFAKILSSTSSNPVHHHQQPAESSMSEGEHDAASSLLILAGGSDQTTQLLPGTSSGCRENDSGGCRFECSSCKKVFGSHQALGGHRASLKNVKGCFAITKSDVEVEDQHQHQHEHHEHGNVLLEAGPSSNHGVDDGNGDEVVESGHQCSICWRVFSSGQALGGHKRCHWERGEDSSVVMTQGGMSSNVNPGGLDLNFPASASTSTSAAAATTAVASAAAAASEDDQCSSSSSSDLGLDLRLGL